MGQRLVRAKWDECQCLTVASLISPVAVWPAQNTRPGILVAGAVSVLISGGRGMSVDSCSCLQL